MGIKNEDVLKIMSPQMGLFGLLFAFMNQLQAAGDAFYKEITVKQFFLLACLNLYPDQALLPMRWQKLSGLFSEWKIT